MAEIQNSSMDASTPRPGDGAFLATAQPGSGHWLSSRGGRGSGPLRRGRGRGGRGGRDNGRVEGMGGNRPDSSISAEPMAGPSFTRGDGVRNGSNDSTAHPHRPRQPRAVVSAQPPHAVSAEPRPAGDAGDSAQIPPPNPESRSRSTKGRKKKPGHAKPNGASPLVNGESELLDRALDPGARAFVPTSKTNTPQTSAPLSRVTSRLSQASLGSHGTDGQESGGNRQPRQKQPKKPRDNAAPAPPSPAVPKSSRRAAFDQQTKLSETVLKEVANGASQTVHLETPVEQVEDKRAVKGKTRRNKEDEKDDLISRLTRGLRSKPFLECPICFNAIIPSQPIWSCLPPAKPPPPPKSPDEPPVNPANHYSSCYTPFHLSCIRDWASRSLVEDRVRQRNHGRDEDEATWRCPGCQKRRPESVGGYRCFCGRLSAPPTNQPAPHSCLDSCQRKRPGCDHPCPLQCHPGPCPPCQTALVVPCPSHHTALTVKCSVASSNNAALTPVCDEVCARERSCGNLDHACMELCHYGPCAPCSAIEVVRCYCGEETRQVACGWNRKEEKKCIKWVDGLDGGAEQFWDGRFACARKCEVLYDCGIHPCSMKCHPHTVRALPCPTSPAVITDCACGSTPLSQLSAPPRKECLAAIPTCGKQCPKSRLCGHQCPRKCHEGDCPPCHEEVVRPCRCGESMLLVKCDELREKVQNGEDICCERVCKALRNCGRHECSRVCCPLSYKAKNRKSKRPEHELLRSEMDDLHECHLTCGRLLSCGLHACQRKDHKGACGKCLQASYEELICHCGHTVVYPPVACGTTINCLYPCARDAPLCGHPRTPHQCHESPQCPPCPFLTTKPCACLKDLAVKNVRCSQEKVSCGQVCGNTLDCGYHRCQLSCHKPGECEDCHQTCNKPKKICRHPCTHACHAPAKCPENDPCQAIITQSCVCGHVQTRTSCGASNSNPNSRETVTLKCNSECAVRQRNARLADALGISSKDGSARGQEEWAADLKSFAVANLAFVKMVEGTFADFIKGTKPTMVLPYMPQAKRTFVMSLADGYRLTRELIDQEPNRSVQIRRRLDTRIPAPLLSSVVNQLQKPSLGGLANLRTGAWGGSAPSTPGPSASQAAGPVAANRPASAAPAPPKPPSAFKPPSVSSKPPTRTSSPAPPTAGPKVDDQGRPIVNGDPDDWDVSDSEA